MTEELKIYYAHPTRMYNQIDENDTLNIIHTYYDNIGYHEDHTIINPADVKISDEDKIKFRGEYENFMAMERKYMFPLIDESDIFIYDDEIPITGGVKVELEYAKEIEIEIITISELNKRLNEGD